ncbi:hypothetical protein NBRC116583_34370 [Arenicella sp. 4NH20-0111]|uniref:ABC-three component system protein n=1 Tax=Arenicella sp. 4NH20-0111 TaxID=3127648 RepID=UPI00310812C9
MSVHSAGFAKLGYLYQIRYALYRAIEDTDAYFIKLESLDDVEVKTDSDTVLFQLKHHVNKINLSDKSVDFWKSIGIWSGQILNEELETEEFKFFLVTTAKVKEKTIASNLLRRMRNTNVAVDLMDRVAGEIENNDLAKSVSNYLALNQQQKIQLCDSITILAEEDNAQDITEKIKQRLELSVQTDFVDDLYSKLEGWWFNEVVSLLFGDREKIWRDEVRDKVIQLSYAYHPDTLPIDFSDAYLGEEQINDFMGYQFVRQLKIIGVGTERIHNAVLDYYKAYNQRTKWIKDDLLIEYDITKYEQRLNDEWKRVRLSVLDELGEGGDQELEKAGRSILNWVETKADLRIRPRVSDKFVMIGSYHMLSNEADPSIGWHPNFSDKLAQLLETEA